MSNIPTSYSNAVGAHNSNLGPYQFNQIPPGQLPGSLKQDANSNNPGGPPAFNNQANHFSQNANSSPAFNHPVPAMMMPPPLSNSQSSPIRPPMKPPSDQNQSLNIQKPPPTSFSPQSTQNVFNASQFPPSQPLRQINDNAPPLIPSSQYQPLMNGPPTSRPPMNQYPPSSTFGPSSNTPTINQVVQKPVFAPASIAPPMISQQNVPLSGPPRNSPLLPPNSTQQVNAPLGPMRNNTVNGPSMPGPSFPPMTNPKEPPRNLMSGPSSLPAGPLPPRPQTSQPMPPSMAPPNSMNYSTPPNNFSGPTSLPMVGQFPPPVQPNPCPPTLKSNMQNRYPQMPTNNLPPQGMPFQQLPPQGHQISAPGHQMPPQAHQMPPPGQQFPPQGPQFQPPSHQIPPQNRMPGLTQQMGQLSVTQQGFDQLWGQEDVDLLQCKHILPPYPEEPPEIRLGAQFADASNCSPEIFRCTINRIPENNSLLQKSRLPLGILIHPFKDLNHLPVIQCTTIVRCRACRTYINPFVYFVDAKRWKCNLCFRVNELPEEFQYDPVSKSYGDPTRRPEIKSATIEFIAPSEYMLRPPQPAVYLFLFDVSQIARESGYLQVVCDVLKANLDQLPGDARTQIGFICYDEHIHYYLMSEGLTRPKEMTVSDIDEVFLPSPESLLVNLGEQRAAVKELLTLLPQRHAPPAAPASALGAALQAAYKLMAPTGGRITVFQTCLPNVGPGALQSREDPNARSSKDVAHLNPATDIYKRLALDCSGAQVAVDLFLLSSQYCDLATLSGMSKFSAGSVYHQPSFRARPAQAAQLARALARYLTRKIGFEAVMRVRCTRGVSIHTFHGNFFVRSTDLLSLPNVSPDAGFGMQLALDEPLADLQHVCFQAALLYTSSKGERRIRVHTLALPIANTLPDVLHAADQYCIIGLLSKMAVDRSATASLSEAREALLTVAVDVLAAQRLARPLPPGSPALPAPAPLRLLPLLLLALLRTKALRTGTSTRLDERVAAMGDLKCLPLTQLMRQVHPDLYPLHELRQHARRDDGDDDELVPDPPRLQLTAERINLNGAYLLDDGETMIIYVCNGVSPAFLSETFGVTAFSQLPDEATSIPKLENDGNALLHAFIEKLNDDRPYPSNILVIRDNSPSRTIFTERLVEDRMESSFSYYEFLQHIKSQLK